MRSAADDGHPNNKDRMAPLFVIRGETHSDGHGICGGSASQKHWFDSLDGATAMRSIEFDGTRFGGDDSHRKRAGMIGHRCQAICSFQSPQVMSAQALYARGRDV
jgi:hypothetical protein